MTSSERAQNEVKIRKTPSAPYVVLNPKELNICVGNPTELMKEYPNLMKRVNDFFNDITKLSNRDMFDDAFMTILGYMYTKGMDTMTFHLPSLDKRFELMDTKEMTVEEIEKELGYKIKMVDKKQSSIELSSESIPFSLYRLDLYPLYHKKLWSYIVSQLESADEDSQNSWASICQLKVSWILDKFGQHDGDILLHSYSGCFACALSKLYYSNRPYDQDRICPITEHNKCTDIVLGKGCCDGWFSLVRNKYNPMEIRIEAAKKIRDLEWNWDIVSANMLKKIKEDLNGKQE